MSFTLFVILPSEDVCSLRNLHSGTTVRVVRKMLELAAGLPAQTYRLTCPQGQLLYEDHVLRLDANVWDGFIMRAHLLDSWQELYDHIVANEIDDVIQHGAVHMRKGAVVIEGEDEGKVKDLVTERGVVALFVSSFLGMLDMCKALLSVGVNPNGKTPFGRTPLFAALSRDNDHVMELLLSHRAALESRDVDGVTAVDVGRRLVAKQCMRKIRHLQLQGRAGDNGSATGPRPVYSSSGASQGQARKGNGHLRVIRIPSGASETTTTVRDTSTPIAAHKRPPTVKLFREASAFTHASTASSGGDSQQRHRTPTEGKFRNGFTPDSRASGVPPSRSRQGVIGGGEVFYTWENNANSVGRTPSAAGMQVRIQTPSVAGTPQFSNGKTSRLGRSYGVSWSDSVSVTSASPRMLPFRPAVHDLTVAVPSTVLTTPATSTTIRSIDKGETDGATGGSGVRKQSALYKYYIDPGLPHNDSHQPHHDKEPHVPAQEPPGRPPSRLESHYFSAADFNGDHPLDKHAGDNSLMGSQEALSVGSAPELQTASGLESLGAGQQPVNHPDSDDDGGRVITSRGTTTRSSGRGRSRLLVSRQKQTESWRTMKRRIKLAEDQKRSTSKPKEKPKAKDQKESFEEWLDRKRREERGGQNSSGSSDDDSDDDDADDRTAENTQAFNEWLKELKERPLSRPQTATPGSLHRRKSRPLKDLIQVGAVADPKADPTGYISAFREWQQGRSHQVASIADIKEARRRTEEKRKQLLAMALTYEDWMEHADERKQLMGAILRADLTQLSAIEQHTFRTRRAPRQISFTQWREKVDRREGEIRQQRQRMRKEAELRQEALGEGRSSAAVAHEVWARRKKEEALRSRGKSRKGGEADKRDATREAKEAAWEAWLERKHKGEVAQLDSHLREERQLLLSLRQKKQPTVTPC